jgi:hypothetical protein
MKVCYALAALEKEWPRIVGPALASRSLPKSWENGVLVVLVDGHAALQDINFRKNAIMSEIRTKAKLKLEDMKIEQGYRQKRVGFRPSAPRPRIARAPRVDPQAEESLKNEILTAHSDLDPELAGLIARCRLASECRFSDKKAL